MAVTTTSVQAFQCALKLDNPSGTLTDYSGVHTKTSVKFDVDSKATYVHASRTPITRVMRKPTGFDIEFLYSTASAELKANILDWTLSTTRFGTAKSIELYIPDTATGSDKYSGEVRLTKGPEFETDAEKADDIVVKITVMEDASGAISVTTV